MSFSSLSLLYRVWTFLDFFAEEGNKLYKTVSAFSHRVPRRLAVVCLKCRSSGVRCSSVVRAFAHGAMGRRINPSWWSKM